MGVPSVLLVLFFPQLESSHTLHAFSGRRLLFLQLPCPSASFPDFLWRPLKEGTDTPRTWITKTRYDKQSGQTASQFEVTVRPSEMEVKISHEGGLCSDFQGHRSACRHWEIDHKAKCLHDTEDGKYAVKKFDKG